MISGIINIHKEAGMTSFDVVSAMRRIAGQRKVGYTGTLDPDATGVLPVCLGTATKVCDLLTDARKTYEADMLLGVETDTQDVGGQVLHTAQVCVDEEHVRDAVLSFLGEYDQIPPMYSAKHVDGRRLYELARQGLVVDRPASRVCVYAIEILQMALPHVTFRVTCSRGTYIRTLIYDIGRKLGCGACMYSLSRTAVGSFLLEHAVLLKDAERYFADGRENEIIPGADELFGQYPAYRVGEHEKALRNGNLIRPGWLIPCGAKTVANWKETFLDNRKSPASDPRLPIRLYLEDGTFAALYHFIREEGVYRPEKMFLTQ